MLWVIHLWWIALLDLVLNFNRLYRESDYQYGSLKQNICNYGFIIKYI